MTSHAINSELKLYYFNEAAALFPSAKLTGRSLRTEYEKGNLVATDVAGKLFVTPDALLEMLKGNTKCRNERGAINSSSTAPTRNMGHGQKEGSSGIFTTSFTTKAASNVNTLRAKKTAERLKNISTTSGSLPKKKSRTDR